MKRYVLGPSSARGLKKLLAGEMLAGRGAAARQGVIDDAAYPLPFTVQWAASLASWVIWLPGEEHVFVGDEPVNLAEKLEAAGGDYPTGWFSLGTLIDTSEGGTLYMNVDVADGTAELSASAGEDTAVKVCVAAVGSDGSRSVKALLTSVISFSPGRAPDDISTGIVTAEDAEDPNAIQIKNFDNSESDGNQGLVQRLSVVKDGEGYRIEASGSSVFLLARVNGKLKYIPLTGADEADDDEKQSTDPCDHPGGGSGSDGGVSPGDDDFDSDPGGGTSGGSSGDGAGGVAADGDVHAGDPCNSEDCVTN